MAYKLLDQNGNKMIINGMNKGYIKVPYNYQGLDWYNVNTTKYQYDYPFYGDVKCIYINGNIFRPYNGTEPKFIPDAYTATQITMSGRRWNEGFDHYEIYLNNELVSTGVFPDKVNTDIYVINKEANTSVILSGEWDSTNSKYIYRITTNAIIPREDSYQWFNPIGTTTINLTVGEGQDCTSTQALNYIRIPSSGTIKNAIASKTGIPYGYINVTKVELDLSKLYWVNGYSGKQSPEFSTSSSITSSTTYFGSGIDRTSSYVFPWSNYKLDVTKYMNTRLFGYNYNYNYDNWNPKYTSFSTSSGSGSYFCQSNGTGLPTFTIVVTYEY